MSEPLPVEFTALAAQHVRDAESWWRTNQPSAPNAVRQELQRAVKLIATQPRLGGRATNVKVSDVRRFYLPLIKYHVYWHVIPEPLRIEVVARWHARRGKGPPI